MPSYVTMLRLLVSPDPLTNTAFFTSLANSTESKGLGGVGAKGEDLSVTVLKRDLKRAKWLDDATTDLGLIRYPHICIHTCIHIYIHTYVHTYIHMLAHVLAEHE